MLDDDEPVYSDEALGECGTILDDPHFFNFPPEEGSILKSVDPFTVGKRRVSEKVCSTLATVEMNNASNHRKRGIESCLYCERPVSSLILGVGCTRECALAQGKLHPFFFNHIFFNFEKDPELCRRNIRILPALKKLEGESYDDFWKRMFRDLYDSSDPRYTFMKINHEANTVKLIENPR
jgi:hypothetical protein